MSDRPSAGLLRRLDLLRARAADLVRLRGADDPAAGDPLRGLHLPVETALQWGSRPHAELDEPAGEPADDRLTQLAVRFGLTALDVHLLLTALAPDVDRRFEPLFGFLNDDVSRRHATIALALDLFGLGPHDATARGRFHPGAPLRRGDLMTVEDDEARPLPGRALRVPERVVAHLLGDDTLDGDLIGAATAHDARRAGPVPDAFGSRLADLLDCGVVVHVRDGHRATSGAVLVDLLRAGGRAVLRYPQGPDLPGHIAALVREARLRDATVVVAPLPERPAPLLAALTGAGVPVVGVDGRAFDPAWSPERAVVSVEPPRPPGSAHLWAAELGDVADIPELADTVAPFRLGPEQVRRAVAAARALSRADGAPLSGTHLQHGARGQSAPLLDRHARRVVPAVGWPDLALPPEPLGQLHELVLRARVRDRVQGQWRLRPGGGRGRGVVALFAGESGTGKTHASEVVAHELGVDLYVVELASVVDKYIGETEKNLDRIFTEADRTDAVLLFDEADAIFGKRSEVKDAHDRYANLESAFLLQRLEAFDGIGVLTTNLRANIDDAFTRRLDLVVDFPFPDAALRLRLWRQSLAHAPAAPDLDLTAVADRYELSGGAIRGAALTAAYLAAGRGEPVSAADVAAGARREYQKMGRLVW